MDFGFFGALEIIFLIVFVLVAVFIVLSWIFSFKKVLRGRGGILEQTTNENDAFVVQREVVREIIKIRCLYCRQLYEENLDNCPYCGAKKL